MAAVDEPVRDGDEPAPPDRRRASVLLWVIGGLVLVAVVVGAVAGVVREPVVFTSESPEGVTQAYLQAMFDDRYRDAHGYLADETARRCSVADLRDAWVPPSPTASLESLEVDGATADVTVRIRTSAGTDPFAMGQTPRREVLTLVNEDGHWRLTDEPWPLTHCWGP